MNLMNKRNLLNLALLGTVAALALVAWLEPGHKPPAEPPKLTDLTPKQVHKIRIERREGKTVVLQRQGETWQMIEPVAAPANSFRIDSMLRVTENKSLGHNPVAGLDLAKYGLDKPVVRLFLDDTEIDFGDSTPLDNRRYVRIGNTVHLIKDIAYYHLIGRYTSFVSLRLLQPQQKVQALELPGLRMSLRDGNWEPDPKPEHYSADAATALIEAWQNAQAIEVRPYDEKTSKPVSGEIRVHLQGEEKPLQLLITARSPDLVLVRPDLGLEYHLAQSQSDELLTLKSEPVKTPPAAKP